MNINLLIIIFLFILFFISQYKHEPFADGNQMAVNEIRTEANRLELQNVSVGLNTSDEAAAIQNVYGDTLQPCANLNDRNNDSGFFDINGMCPHGQILKDRKKTLNFPPRLCMKFKAETQNFALKTGYGSGARNWSKNFAEDEKNNCATLGSFSYFKSQQNKNPEEYPATYDELKCSAIPEEIFSTAFYEEWNKGKKKKFKDDDQIIHGLKSVFIQCLDNTSVPQYRSNIKNKFCKFINSDIHNLKDNKTIKELFEEYCVEEDDDQ